jgi:hypothetical protein
MTKLNFQTLEIVSSKIPNKTTKKAMIDVRKNKNMNEYKSLDELKAKLTCK